MFPDSISLGFWNVHGLGKKLEEDSFRSSLVKLDFFSLLETWSSETSEVDLPNYQHFSSLRKKQRKARRNSGGIIFYFKNELAKFIKRESSTSEDILWIRISKELFGLSRDIFIGNVYISPMYSSIHKRAEESIFDVLEQDIARFASRGYVILGGDFNSRIGSLKDFAAEAPIDSDLEPQKLSNLDIPRNFSDNGPPNTFGKDLTDLCSQSDLRILNGRILGDLSGRFTCYQPSGCSTVDYAIASSALFHKISIFRVHPLT